MMNSVSRKSPGSSWLGALVPTVLLLTFGATIALCQTIPQRATAKQEVDVLMRTLSARGQFSGAVLVGDANGILYEGAFGLASHDNRMKFTTETQSCLASVSKPFTALAVMMLVQQGSIHLDDPVSKYVDGLQKPVGEVTIRELLNHTSGIPDYENANIEHPGITTEEVLRALRTIDHLEFPAGERYHYSNSGYVLLGAVVAKSAGMPFPQFMTTRILGPAGMKRTFVLTHDGQKTSQTATGYNDFGDRDDYVEFITGDGGMYSTVEDLYLFDRALYRGTLVSQVMLNAMFTPGTVHVGTTTYGFGWNAESTGEGQRVWHTGKTAGFRAYFERQPAKQRVIILLKNFGDSKTVEIAAAINKILDGEPFSFPKRSGAVELEKVYRSSGIDNVLATYALWAQKSAEDVDISEGELNSLGYRILYNDHNPPDAIRVFALTVTKYPSSSNAFDSLGEAYKVSGDIKAAKTNYEKAVAMDPTNDHARNALAQLK